VNFLIDTNIISEVRKGKRCNPNVARWYEHIADESLYLSVLVLGEIRKGIERIRSRDPSQAHAIESWLQSVDKAFRGRILAVDRFVADEWGRLNAGRAIPVIDGLLAATSKVHRMTLVTRNKADLAGLEVDLLDPFEAH
jgi:predicted nucleic acid-binding protein